VGRLFRQKILHDMQFEYALCLLLIPHRLRLPSLGLQNLFPNFDSTVVRLERMPKGSWSSPVVDLATLCKLISLLQPRKVLELGCFRGYTSYGIASHLAENGHLVAMDCNPEHGEAYKNTDVAKRIERRVGFIDPQMFSEDELGSYDVIFIDADHRYAAVEHDTQTVLPYLAEDGWLVWHDYANWGYFSGACGVPEYLSDLSQKLPVVQITGTNMALHRPIWSQRRHELDAALSATYNQKGKLWEDGTPRS